MSGEIPLHSFPSHATGNSIYLLNFAPDSEGKKKKKIPQVVLFCQHVNWPDYERKQSQGQQEEKIKQTKGARHRFSTMYSTEAANQVKKRVQLSSSLLVRVTDSSQENIDALLSSITFCFFSSNINENSHNMTNF